MCDYSLHHVANRPAKIEDELVATKFHNSVTSRIRSSRAAEHCGLSCCPVPRSHSTVLNASRRSASASCRSTERSGSSSRFRQVDAATPWPIPRLAGNSRRAGGSRSRALYNGRRAYTAIAGRVACRNCGGRPSSSGSFAESLAFDLDRADGCALIDGCNTKHHRLCHQLIHPLALTVPQPCRPILEHSISVCYKLPALRLIPAGFLCGSARTRGVFQLVSHQRHMRASLVPLPTRTPYAAREELVPAATGIHLRL